MFHAARNIETLGKGMRLLIAMYTIAVLSELLPIITFPVAIYFFAVMR